MSASAPTTPRTVIVVGAGPAGLAAAVHAALNGARATLVEKMPVPGVKLLSTGGGHCNITNTAGLDEFLASFGRTGRFARDVMAAFGSRELRAFLEGIGVPTHAPDGRHVLPRSNSARTVRDALAAHAEELGVDLVCGRRVEAIAVELGRVAGVVIDGRTLCAQRVVLAAGGQSHPGLGSSGDGFALARDAGHAIVQPVPALVPLVVDVPWIRACAGISVADAEVGVEGGRASARRSRGDIVFTHVGLSGPAVLDVSGDAARALADGRQARLVVRLTPECDAAAWAARLNVYRATAGAAMVRTLLAERLPARLAAALVGATCRGADVRASSLGAAERRALCRSIAALELPIAGTEGFERSMATRGGVSLDGVYPKSLESRLVRGLFFAGELLDLDGPCGGYNLQWALSSGAVAGAAAAR